MHLTGTNAPASHDQDEISPRRFILLQSAFLYLPLSILLALTLGSEVIHDEDRNDTLDNPAGRTYHCVHRPSIGRVYPFGWKQEAALLLLLS